MLKVIKYTKGGNVPGGHYVLCQENKKPFVCPTKEMNAIKLDKRDIVADIGGYTGLFALRCARYPVKMVYSYEPTIESFNVLNTNKLCNLKCYNKAVVGNDDKTIRFYISKKGVGVCNSIVSKKNTTFVDIECINYTDVIKDCNIIKIDIEGGEYSIPLNEFIVPNKKAYLIDFHKIKGVEWPKRPIEMVKRLKDLDYKMVIEPKWDNGWTRAGAWINEKYTYPKDSEGNKLLLTGKLCVGCNKKINCKNKAICIKCDKLWSKKHKKGYEIAKKN